MTWFAELRRRLSALLGWLRRRVRTATARPSLPATPAAAEGTPAEPPVVGASLAAATVASTPASTPTSTPTAGESVVAPSRPGIDPSLAQLKARQFFARMIAATPAGLTIDFSDWRSASVERFFLAMTSPGLTRRREVPTNGSEQVSLTNAFQGFEWD
jgi:hypothetical protein